MLARLIAAGLLLLASGCQSLPSLEPTPAPATPTVLAATPTPDRVTIVSPDFASGVAFPTPTTYPTQEPIPTENLIVQPSEVQPLAARVPLQGQLDDTGGRMSDGTFFDAYEFRAEPGELVLLKASSSEFDTLLYVVDGAGSLLAANDDHDYKSSTDSQLAWYAPHAARYQLFVTSFEPAQGGYTLLLSTADHREAEQPLSVDTPSRGWLTPGDDTTPDGLYADHWVIEMREQPLVVWARSASVDPQLAAYDADGTLLVRNGDQDRIANNYDARLFLAPSNAAPAGSLVTLEVAQQGAFAGLGGYELVAVPLPAMTEPLTVKVRPVIVKGADGERGSDASTAQFQHVLQVSNEAWRVCGIQFEAEPLQTISVPGLEFTIPVSPPASVVEEWTPEENSLMYHPSHATPDEGVITAFIVRLIGQGQQYGIAYPTTRYPARRSGMVVVAQSELVDEAFFATLGHELGHVLGLSHPDLNDGDPLNDTAENLMLSGEGIPGGLVPRLYGGLSPLQCVTARGTEHFIHPPSAAHLPEPFLRPDRVLLPGDAVSGTLIPRDTVTQEEEEQFLDVLYLYGHEGDTLTIDLMAQEFDPFLIVDGPDGERLLLQDDGGEGWNARATLTLPQTGDYTLGVTSYTRAVGQYDLSISRPGAP